MQYPVPVPWRDERPPRLVNNSRTNPRFAHLPLIKGHPDRTIEVVRGDADLAARLANRPETQELFEEPRAGKVYFVVENRLGGLWFGPAGRRTHVGLLENHLYTEPLRLNDALAEATTLSELRAVLHEQIERLDRLEADGWEVTSLPGHPGFHVLVDTLRPDEDLTEDDLP